MKPAKAFFGAATGVRVSFRASTDSPTRVSVRFTRGGNRLRHIVVEVKPGSPGVVVPWNGRTDAGKVAPDGRYGVSVKAKGAGARRIGRVALHGYRFPVRGPHGSRGAIGRFHAPRSGGRTHQGFDVVADCGTPLVAARAGTVVRRGYDPELYGNYLLINGRATRRSLFYAHLIAPAEVKRGDRVFTGTRLGLVGRTGNARTTPCHLHFEIRVHGRALDPEPFLRAWNRHS